MMRSTLVVVSHQRQVNVAEIFVTLRTGRPPSHSVTRFGKIPPLWQNFKALEQFFEA